MGKSPTTPRILKQVFANLRLSKQANFKAHCPPHTDVSNLMSSETVAIESMRREFLAHSRALVDARR